MDSIPKAIEDLMADDPEGEVEIVLRRARHAPEPPPPAADPAAEEGEAPAISALQASINRGTAKPRAPKSYSMPRKAP